MKIKCLEEKYSFFGGGNLTDQTLLSTHRQNVVPDLDPNFMTLWCYSWNNIVKKVMLKNICRRQKIMENYPACRVNRLTICVGRTPIILFIIITGKRKWAVARDFQQYGILTCVDSDEPLQPPFKLRNTKWCLVSSLTLIEYSSD